MPLYTLNGELDLSLEKYKLYQREGSHAVVGRKLYDNMETIRNRSGRQTVPWTEDIPIKDIVLHFLGNRGQMVTTTC